MGYINKIQIDTDAAHLIEPTLYTTSTLLNNVYSASLTDFILASGVAIQIKFSDTNLNISPTLNINNTGGKKIYYEDMELGKEAIKDNHIYTLIYDSLLDNNNGGWRIVGDFDTQANYGNITTKGELGTASSLVITDNSKKITTGAVLSAAIISQDESTQFLREDGTWAVPTNVFRAIKVDSVQKLASNVNTALNFIGGANINLTYDVSGSITIDATNTWTPMTGATSNANGTIGYINAAPPSDGYNTKFLRADGTWAEPAQSVLSISTYNILGGVKPAYSNLSSIGLGTGNSAASYTDANIVLQDRQTETNRYYAVEVDSQGRLYVNIPWTNINSNYQEQLTFDGTYDSTSNPVATVDTVNNAVTELNNNIVQYKSWAINGLANSCNITDNITDKTQVLSLVVTSGFSNLKGALSWEVTTNNNSYQLIISSASAVSGTANNIAVSGYVIITNGTDLDNSNI